MCVCVCVCVVRVYLIIFAYICNYVRVCVCVGILYMKLYLVAGFTFSHLVVRRLKTASIRCVRVGL